MKVRILDGLALYESNSACRIIGKVSYVEQEHPTRILREHCPPPVPPEAMIVYTHLARSVTGNPERISVVSSSPTTSYDDVGAVAPYPWRCGYACQAYGHPMFHARHPVNMPTVQAPRFIEGRRNHVQFSIQFSPRREGTRLDMDPCLVNSPASRSSSV